MNIDPTKKYTSGGSPVSDLHPFAGGWVGLVHGRCGVVMWRFDSAGGRLRDSGVRVQHADLDLREVDPVAYYANVYDDSVGGSYQTLGTATRSRRLDGADRVAILAVHKSGRTRTLPADATSDPEGGAV